MYRFLWSTFLIPTNDFFPKEVHLILILIVNSMFRERFEIIWEIVD